MRESTRQKISDSLKGRKHDESRRAAIREGISKESNKQERLLKTSINRGAKEFEMVSIETGELIYRGYMVSEAARIVGCNSMHIRQVMYGTRKTIMGKYTAYRLNLTEDEIERNRQRKEKLKETTNKYSRNRMTNMHARIVRDLRSRLSISVRYSGRYKSGSAIELLGCSIEELMKHLESKFQPGMTWNNRGYNGWHIDHIVPLSSIDVSDIEQLRKVCHYTNLQPLWAIDNYRKGNRVIESQDNSSTASTVVGALNNPSV